MVSARREGDTVIVFIPGWMSDAEERRWKARQEHAADPAPGPIPPLRPSFGR